jgi:hypothetical protein
MVVFILSVIELSGSLWQQRYDAVFLVDKASCDTQMIA